MSHVPTPTTGRPVFSARAISESVPKPPPTATSASDARTTSPLRNSPMPVGTTTDSHGLPAARSVPGSSPRVSPPASRAPRHAAAITPPSPPQTTIAPAVASSRPTTSAARSRAASASPAPTTATYAGWQLTSAPSTPREAARDGDGDSGGGGDGDRNGGRAQGRVGRPGRLAARRDR